MGAQRNDASYGTYKRKKNLYISGDIRDGSDQRLWMSLIFSKMEQRGQKERMSHTETARMRSHSE